MVNGERKLFFLPSSFSVNFFRLSFVFPCSEVGNLPPDVQPRPPACHTNAHVTSYADRPYHRHGCARGYNSLLPPPPSLSLLSL